MKEGCFFMSLPMAQSIGVVKQINKRAALLAAENSFELIAREWYAKYSVKWVPSHGERIIRRLERDIFPWLGKRPIADPLSNASDYPLSIATHAVINSFSGTPGLPCL